MQIKAKITKGMFPGEKLVEIQTNTGPLSAFVLDSRVNEVKQALEVTLVQGADGGALVRFPSQSGEYTVRVGRGEVLGDVPYVLCPECFKKRGATEEKSCSHGCLGDSLCVGCGRVKEEDGLPFWSCIGQFSKS
jgi:hypothetical protein